MYICTYYSLYCTTEVLDLVVVARPPVHQSLYRQHHGCTSVRMAEMYRPGMQTTDPKRQSAQQLRHAGPVANGEGDG